MLPHLDANYANESTETKVFQQQWNQDYNLWLFIQQQKFGLSTDLRFDGFHLCEAIRGISKITMQSLYI